MDIEWWIDYLTTWNGIGYFPEYQWTDNQIVNFWTDASDYGIGATFQDEWFSRTLARMVTLHNRLAQTVCSRRGYCNLGEEPAREAHLVLLRQCQYRQHS